MLHREIIDAVSPKFRRRTKLADTGSIRDSRRGAIEDIIAHIKAYAGLVVNGQWWVSRAKTGAALASTGGAQELCGYCGAPWDYLRLCEAAD